MSTIGNTFAKALGAGLVSILVASTGHAGTIGQSRCAALERQLSAIRLSVAGDTPKSVNDLAGKAQTLCLDGKTAQGLRAYAKALGILGSQPVLPADQQIDKPQPHPQQRSQS